MSNFQFHETSSKWQTQVSEIHDGTPNMFEVTMQRGEEVEENNVGEKEDVESRVGVGVQFNQSINALKWTMINRKMYYAFTENQAYLSEKIECRILN